MGWNSDGTEYYKAPTYQELKKIAQDNLNFENANGYKSNIVSMKVYGSKVLALVESGYPNSEDKNKFTIAIVMTQYDGRINAVWVKVIDGINNVHVPVSWIKKANYSHKEKVAWINKIKEHNQWKEFFHNSSPGTTIEVNVFDYGELVAEKHFNGNKMKLYWVSKNNRYVPISRLMGINKEKINVIASN